MRLFLFIFLCTLPVFAQESDLTYDRITTLETQLTDMTGQMEEMSHRLTLLENMVKKMNADVNYRFQNLSDNKEAENIPVADDKTESKKDPVEEKPTENQPAEEKSVTEKNPVEQKPLSPEEAYQNAYSSLTAAHYEEAQEKLQQFLKDFPDHALSGNAQYWLAETYYVQGLYEKAVVLFAEGYTKYKTGTKGPDTLLKLGMSMERLKKNKEACFAFKNLEKEFPKAPKNIIKKAKEEAKKLKCPK